MCCCPPLVRFSCLIQIKILHGLDCFGFSVPNSLFFKTGFLWVDLAVLELALLDQAGLKLRDAACLLSAGIKGVCRIFKDSLF